MSIAKAEEYISMLNLKPHPEGGYYTEVYRSDEMIKDTHLPERYSSSHSFGTSIYFLLKGKDISKFHKLSSDEIWHFYDGSEVIIYILSNEGTLNKEILGRKIDEGSSFQITIPGGNWFAAELKNKNSFALVGCTVSPGFEFEDFELAERDHLVKKFPEYTDIIAGLT